MVKLFIEKLNCKKKIPKLPSTKKACEVKWKNSCLIKLTTAQMKDDYESLHSHLGNPTDSVQPENAQNDKTYVINNVWEESSNK